LEILLLLKVFRVLLEKLAFKTFCRKYHLPPRGKQINAKNFPAFTVNNKDDRIILPTFPFHG